MRLIGLLSQVSAFKLVTAILASVMSGVADMGATICVLEFLRAGRGSWWLFGLIALASVVLGRHSRSALNRLASKSVMRLRRRLVRSLLHVPLLDLERIGPTRLLVAFTSDIGTIASAVRNLASLFTNAAVLLACLLYIGWLSPVRLAVTATLCGVCIIGAVLLRLLEKSHRHSARGSWDTVLHAFTAVLDGLKELKVNRPLARTVLQSFERHLREHQASNGVRGRYSDWVAVWTNAMFYLILGTAVFGPFGDEVGLRLSFGLLALLKIRRPLGSLIVDSAAFADAAVALRRITDAGLTLADGSADRERPAPTGWRDLRSLELENVAFRYDGDGPQDCFRLGPLNGTLHPGQIVFVAGRHAGGKTTLAKILTGLYRPESGTVKLNGIPLDDANERWYRGKVAALFSDFALFDDAPETAPVDLDRETARIAAALIPDAARRDALPSTPPAAIPLGERRRLALLRAIVEDRPILVVDGWPADQDPEYKTVFYNELLPHLRQSGKLVIVTSQDEQYFGIADAVLRLEPGRLPVWAAQSSTAEPTYRDEAAEALG